MKVLHTSCNSGSGLFFSLAEKRDRHFARKLENLFSHHIPTIARVLYLRHEVRLL